MLGDAMATLLERAAPHDDKGGEEGADEGGGDGGDGGDGGGSGGEGGVNMQMHGWDEEHEPVLPPPKT